MSEKRKYTLGEEIFNSVSHGVGACLSVAGTAVMIVASVIHTDVWGIVSSCIYGASLIILYTMSTLYHSFTNKKAKAFFRIMDHNTIFLLIAGTYTHYSLLSARRSRLDIIRHSVGCGNIRNCNEFN